MNTSKRKKRSPVWDHFTQIDNEKAQCGICLQMMSISHGSLGNLLRHIRTKHPAVKIVVGSYGQSREVDPKKRKPSTTSSLSASDVPDSPTPASPTTSIPAHPVRKQQNRAVTQYILQRNIKDSDDDEEYTGQLETEDGALISEIVYLEDGDEVGQKKYTALFEPAKTTEKINVKRHRQVTPEKIKMKTQKLKCRASDISENESPVYLLAADKKEKQNNDDTDTFSKYLNSLLNSLPKYIQTKLQMEIVNIVIKAKLEYETKLREKEEPRKSALVTTDTIKYSITPSNEARVKGEHLVTGNTKSNNNCVEGDSMDAICEVTRQETVSDTLSSL